MAWKCKSALVKRQMPSSTRSAPPEALSIASLFPRVAWKNCLSAQWNPGKQLERATSSLANESLGGAGQRHLSGGACPMAVLGLVRPLYFTDRDLSVRSPDRYRAGRHLLHGH